MTDVALKIFRLPPRTPAYQRCEQDGPPIEWGAVLFVVLNCLPVDQELRKSELTMKLLVLVLVLGMLLAPLLAGADDGLEWEQQVGPSARPGPSPALI